MGLEAASRASPLAGPLVRTPLALLDFAKLRAASQPCSSHPWEHSLLPKEIEDVQW